MAAAVTLGAPTLVAAPASAQAVFHAASGQSTNADWAGLVLRDGGWPVSADNLTVLQQWMASEEPPDAWWYRDNPLNNGLAAPAGAYPDLATAAYYVAVNLDAGDDGYPAVAADLARSAPPATTAKAIWASSWASGHYGHGVDWWKAAVPTVAAPPSAWFAEGELVKVTATGQVDELVGGAALAVPAADVTRLEGSPPKAPVPVDAAELALLAARPASGTLVRSVQTGAVYVVAGGAPLYVADCAELGGCTGAVPVDQWDLDHRGASGAGFAAVPADGTVLADARSGQDYVVAGGAPLAVARLTDLGPGAPTPVAVDDWDLANAGIGGIHPFETLARRPVTGTLLRGATTGRIYQVDAAGAAVPVATPAAGTPVNVDQLALDRAGAGGVWDHLANDPPTVPFTPAQVTTAASTVVVHVPHPVLSSALAALSVRYRVGPTGGRPGVWRMPAAWRMSGAPAFTYTDLAVGETVCFEVRATDVDRVSSGWTGDRCWSRT